MFWHFMYSVEDNNHLLRLCRAKQLRCVGIFRTDCWIAWSTLVCEHKELFCRKSQNGDFHRMV